VLIQAGGKAAGLKGCGHFPLLVATTVVRFVRLWERERDGQKVGQGNRGLAATAFSSGEGT